jgi:hypothetical protein
MWRDLTSEPIWKYGELPPVLLVELTKLDLFEVGDSELARAQWFWSRRRKLALHATAALLVAGLSVALSLAIAFLPGPGNFAGNTRRRNDYFTPGSGCGDLPNAQRIRFVRWQREYERSVDRLIHTIHPGREGGSAIEW